MVLEAQGLTKTFQGVVALSDVALRLRAGEIHSLMGENGAGKSTLIKLLSGLYSPDRGTIRLEGREVRPTSNNDAQKIGISTVFQEVNLIPTMTVAENVFLGREPKKWGRIDWKAMREGARRALARLEVDIDVDRQLEDYPIAIQQMVAIARALDFDAKVLILDEATSSLDRDEVERLFTVLRGLRKQGLAIVFISHFLDQIYEICDRVTVLRNGHFIGEWTTAELSRTELIAKMMGRELLAAEKAVAAETDEVKRVKPWLECKDFGRGAAIQPFELEVRPGETLGLAGLLGSGRTEIARLLFGLDSATSGSMTIDGEPVKFSNPADAIDRGFAMAPEDRKTQAIFPQLSVRENIILALQNQRGWARALSRDEQDRIADQFIKAMGIRAYDAEQPIETLSGGNQQKAILARWLALDPRLLILDEPTRGIDVGAKAEILKLIHEQANKGKSVVLITSELEELVRVSDRVAVLKDRRKIGELAGSQLTEQAIMSTIGEAP
ncbi:MAG: sugar ABC transporter ATP-binding protein [Bdellovibrionota bacterium]